MFDIDLTNYRVIDISRTIVPTEKGDRPFIVKRGLLADGSYKYDVINTHTHVGTHVELPLHFYGKGESPDTLDLSNFMGRGLLFDAILQGEDRAIEVEALERSLGSRIRPRDIVVFRNPLPYDVNDRTSLPYITPEVAEWLRSKAIKMLVLDYGVRLSKDIPDGRNIHDILMRDGITILEFPDNLMAIKKDEFYVIALPLKFSTIDSSWVRAIVIEEVK